jgi:lipoic acid synthetase
MDRADFEKKRLKKPYWLKRPIASGESYQEIRDLLKEGHLHTVCQEALCPNLGECFSKKTATFLILGDRCTRNCRFCAIDQGISGHPDPDEPRRVAEAAKHLGLRYVVVTSVTRDDLQDGGAAQFEKTVFEIRRKVPKARIELLIPDFQGSERALRRVVDACPDVLNHNMETVPRLYPTVRPEADYNSSLRLLRRVHEWAPEMTTKSGLMLGLGEARDELLGVFADLLTMNCRVLTLGQYLQPSKNHLPVKRFVPPEEFDELKGIALDMGFLQVASGPFVRSSYHAGELFRAMEMH